MKTTCKMPQRDSYHEIAQAYSKAVCCDPNDDRDHVEQKWFKQIVEHVVVVESMAAITIVDAMFANMSARMDSLEKFYRWFSICRL